MDRSETPGNARLEEYVLTTQPTIDANAIQKIHIGNLALASSEASVREMFAKHGEVCSYERPVDKVTNAPGGFAYVGMARAEATKAISALNGQQLDGQALRISEAKPPRS